MRNSFFIIIIFVFNSISVLSQSNEVFLQGEIDTSIINRFAAKELLLKIHDPIRALHGNEEMIRVALNENGTFRVKISSESEFLYLSFKIENQSEINKLSLGAIISVNFPVRERPGSDEIYLFEKGDNVRVAIKSDGIFFTGLGAEKLNCQSQIFRADDPNTTYITTLRTTYYQEKRYEQFFKLMDEARELDKKLSLGILEGFRSKVNQQVFKVLALNVVSYSELKMLSVFNHSIIDNDPRIIAREHYKAYFSKKINDDGISNSIYYPRWIFQKEWKAQSLYNANSDNETFFDDVYKKITSNYSGNSRDLAVLQAFGRLSKEYPGQVRSKIDSGIASMSNPLYKDALKKWKQSQFLAYPFELEDVNGKIHKLSDYKGKIVVIDFWFTFCGNCVMLNAAMHSIIEKYKNNPDIVFISICEDQKKEQWIKSLSTGAYTSPGTINLYTNGLGGNHPIMAYYNILGGPHQFIIDRKGLIISAKPPRPDEGDDDKLFSIDTKTKQYRPHPNAELTMKNPNAIAFMKILDDALVGE